MIINIDGRKYFFKFQHNTSGDNRGTVCTISNEDGTIVDNGTAHVHPKDNNFCKEKGRKLALQRALSKWDKNYKQQVWDNYRTWGKQRF